MLFIHPKFIGYEEDDLPRSSQKDIELRFIKGGQESAQLNDSKTIIKKEHLKKKFLLWISLNILDTLNTWIPLLVTTTLFLINHSFNILLFHYFSFSYLINLFVKMNIFQSR